MATQTELQPFTQQPQSPQQRTTKSRKQSKAYLFKKKLQENDGCCSSWCSAHFFLIYLLLQNIVQIVISAYQIKVLQDPYNTHEICYNPGNGGEVECYDEREFYEANGLSVTFVSIVIGFCGIHLIVNIASFHALQTCNSTIFFIEWLLLNVQIIFILCHSILAGVYYGLFAILLPMLLSCYFWMIYQLAKYFEKGGIYDCDMNYMSPSPNNYAVIYVANPKELAEYHEKYEKSQKNLDKKPADPNAYKILFKKKMTEYFDMCCCKCNLMIWTIIWIIYMLAQNSFWFIISVLATVILYDDYGEWMDCTAYGYYGGDDGNNDTNGGGDGDDLFLTSTTTFGPIEGVDCRELFEENGLTKGFSILTCIVAAIAIIINGYCWYGINTCNKFAILIQVWYLFIQALFMLLFSVFTRYYFGFFALLIPLCLSCHFYSIYVLAVYCSQSINSNKIPKMQAVVYKQQVIEYKEAPKQERVQTNDQFITTNYPQQPQPPQQQPIQIAYVPKEAIAGAARTNIVVNQAPAQQQQKQSQPVEEPEEKKEQEPPKPSEPTQ